VPASHPPCAAASGTLAAVLTLAGHLGRLITRGQSRSCRGDTPWARSIVDMWTRTMARSTGDDNTTSPFQRINAHHVMPRQRLHSRQPQLRSLTPVFFIFYKLVLLPIRILTYRSLFLGSSPGFPRFLHKRPFSSLFAYKPLYLYV
jgi:hypothetical protein